MDPLQQPHGSNTSYTYAQFRLIETHVIMWLDRMGKVCCSARLHQKRRYCFLRRCYAADLRTFRSDDHSGSGEEEDEMRQPPLFFFPSMRKKILPIQVHSIAAIQGETLCSSRSTCSFIHFQSSFLSFFLSRGVIFKLREATHTEQLSILFHFPPVLLRVPTYINIPQSKLSPGSFADSAVLSG